MLLRVLAASALAVLLTTAACGGDAGGVSVTQVPHTPSRGDGTAVPATASAPPATEPADTPPPSPTTPPTVDERGAVVVPCGDHHAPLDKDHRLPADCEPPALELLPAAFSLNGEQYLMPEAAGAFVDFVEAAAAEGYAIFALSTYRSYATQEATFESHVASLGIEQAERVSARPGHSEHQLGTTVDVTSASAGYELVEAFGSTPEGRWVAENAWRFGFVISYPEGFEAITGYAYEPWHLRWVGEAMAADVRQSGLTLREYLLR